MNSFLQKKQKEFINKQASKQTSKQTNTNKQSKKKEPMPNLSITFQVNKFF